MVAGLAPKGSPERVLYIMVLAAAAGIVQGGAATSLLCGSIPAAALAAQAVTERDRIQLHSRALRYGAVLLLPTIASGTLAWPLFLTSQIGN
jgi:hypothetical protein